MSQENKDPLPLYLECTSQAEIERWTDDYFINSRNVVEKNGESDVIYAVFTRQPGLMASKLAVEWLEAVAKEQNFSIEIMRNFEEGEEIPPTEPSMFIQAPMSKMVELETIFLQKIGAVSLAALNARDACLAIPQCPFIAMDARHDAGREMQEQMAYAAKVGSDAAKKINPAVQGYVGTSNSATAKLFFGLQSGLGTMPHALIGYAKNDLLKKGLLGKENVLVHTARLYKEANPDKKFILLPDFDGQEITDSIAVCKAFPEEVARGEIMFRLDTHGGRYLEGLDAKKSLAVMKKYAPKVMEKDLSDTEKKNLVGKGVSAAAIHFFKENLALAGYPDVGIVGSSGFNKEKCKTLNEANAPVDTIGTGSYLPKIWSQTYATADIISYDGNFSVKVGRENLVESYKNRQQKNIPNVA